MSDIKVSVVIASFRRGELLHWGLTSLANQITDLPVEVIVVNDGVADDTEGTCTRQAESFASMRYLFSGHRNTPEVIPRNPGHAINVGMRRAQGDVIITACPESFLIARNLVQEMAVPILNGDKVMTGPELVLDDDSGFLGVLRHSGDYQPNDIDKLKQLRKQELKRGNNPFIPNPKAPYFMAFSREAIWDMGGYDEDFEYGGAEDNDFTDRLETLGHSFQFVPGTIAVHLFHGRMPVGDRVELPGYKRNVKRWKSRAGDPIRNRGKSWGTLPDDELPPTT